MLFRSAALTYRFSASARPACARIIFDSDLNRTDTIEQPEIRNVRFRQPLNPPPWGLPASLVKDFRIEVERDGKWELAARVCDNRQCLARIPLDGADITAARLICETTWGAADAHLFAFDIR